ncbi:MAG: hypothetical protein JRG86_14180 [Deltaproteobacteria bacterium]|jgi:hypothetical protein|nr:hypothetical protein [Deltaproteobacteria bacterium]
MTEPMVSECVLFLSRVMIDPEGGAAQTEANNVFAQGPEAVQAWMAQQVKEMQG